MGSSKPAIMRSTVVLPLPDGPSSEKNSPSSIVEVDRVDGDDLVVAGAERLAQPDELDGRVSAVERHVCRCSRMSAHDA